MGLVASIFLGVLAVGAPIAIALAASPLIYIITNTDLPLVIVPQRMFVAADSFVLIALPLFILAGSLMNEGQITPKIVRLAQFLVGRLNGSLGHVTVVVCMFFGGITGAAVAECTAVGSVLIPAMIKDGYSKEYAGSLTASASVMGPIIPPSIPMIVYAMLSDTSVGALFLAGAVPGVMIGVSMMIYNYFATKKPTNYNPKLKMVETLVTEKGDGGFLKKLMGVRDGILVMGMPLIIIGGIVGGVFTATESAAAAAFYAFFLGYFVFKTLKMSTLPRLFLEASVVTSIVMFIMAASYVLTWVLTYEEIPTAVTNMFLSYTENRMVFLMLLTVLMLLVGTFLDPSGCLILLVPIILPLSKTLGFDPVHFGTFMVIGLVIGLLTPPCGSPLYIACSLTGLSLDKISIACFPFICLLTGILILVGIFPSLSLWLPGVLIGYQPVGWH